MDGVGAGGGREGPPPKSTNLDSQADTFIIEAADLGVIYKIKLRHDNTIRVYCLWIFFFL